VPKDKLQPSHANFDRRRASNDAFRSDLLAGATMLSAGLIALGDSVQRTVLEAVRWVTEFDDDAKDDHAVGDVEVEIRTGNEPCVKLLVFFSIETVNFSGQPTQLMWLRLADEWWGAENVDGSAWRGIDEADPLITDVDDCTAPVNDTTAPLKLLKDDLQHAQRQGATDDLQETDPGSAISSLTSDADAPSAKIRRLNDSLRRTLEGGTVLITAGIAALDAVTQARVIAAVQTFDQFNDDNDPWGEHDMGALQLDGHRIFFKLDYYDLTRSMLAEDPSDPSKTERVLTIMQAEEY
jgi:hypothetical protein